MGGFLLQERYRSQESLALTIEQCGKLWDFKKMVAHPERLLASEKVLCLTRNAVLRSEFVMLNSDKLNRKCN